MARLAVAAGITLLLVYQLSRIGWEAVLRELPTTPWFYVTLLALYFMLPTTELLIYGRFWKIPRGRLFSALVRKRVLNVDVLGFSGEVYLHLWAKERLGSPGRSVFRLIVDNGIASSIGSYLAIGLLLSVLFLSDSVAFDFLVGRNWIVILFSVAMLLGVGSVVLYRFRHSVFSIPGRSVLAVTGVHVARFILTWMIQILHWWVVLPDTPLRVWGTMLAVVTVTNRLPFVPARDLISTSVILGLGPGLGAFQPAIAAMLVVRSLIEKLLNATLFASLSVRDSIHPAVTDDERESADIPTLEPDDQAPGTERR